LANLICGFARFWFIPWELFANNGYIFLKICPKRRSLKLNYVPSAKIPLVFLTKYTGFMVANIEAGGIANTGPKCHCGSFVPKVPKFTILIGARQVFGAGN